MTGKGFGQELRPLAEPATKRAMYDQPRGRHLVAADRRFATGGGLLAHLLSGSFSRILDRIDGGLEQGGIEATLPDGSRRLLGGRRPGPRPIVVLHSWRSLARQ